MPDHLTFTCDFGDGYVATLEVDKPTIGKRVEFKTVQWTKRPPADNENIRESYRAWLSTAIQQCADEWNLGIVCGAPGSLWLFRPHKEPERISPPTLK